MYLVPTTTCIFVGATNLFCHSLQGIILTSVQDKTFNSYLTRGDIMSKEYQVPNHNLWEHLNEYVLVGQSQDDYIICHLPSKTLLIIEDNTEFEATIERMLQLKVQVIDMKTLKHLIP
jgi:hypothetical protein